MKRENSADVVSVIGRDEKDESARGCECIELYGERENYKYTTFTKIDYKEED